MLSHGRLSITSPVQAWVKETCGRCKYSKAVLHRTNGKVIWKAVSVHPIPLLEISDSDVVLHTLPPPTGLCDILCLMQKNGLLQASCHNPV